MNYKLEATPVQFDLHSTSRTDASRPIWQLKTNIHWKFWADDLLLIDDVCPVGMETDLGSIPPELSSMISGDAQWNLAYILHDRWCVQKWLNNDLASELLYTACIKFGCPAWKAWLIYAAVRNFGPQFSGGPSQIQGDN